MARHLFGGRPGDYAILPPSRTSGVVQAARATTGGTAWDAATGGNQHTDLLPATGTTPPVSTDADGFPQPFYGPDGVRSLWVDLGGGRRVLLEALDVVDVVDAAASSASSAAASAQASSEAAQAAAVATPTQIDSHLGGDATNLVPTVAGKADTADVPALVGDEANDPASPMRTTLAQVYVSRVRLADAPTPWIIPHKGGLAIAPEHTDEAYRTSLAAGFKWVDMDLQPLADGALANHHNTSVDSIMVESGNTTDFTTPEWLNLNIDAGTWFAPDWPNDIRPTLGRDVLRRYSTAALFSIENKAAGYMDKTVAAVLAEGLQHSVILSSATFSDLAAAQDAGIPTAHITDTPDAATLLAAGTEYAVISATVTDSVITNAVSAGLKVICWNVARRSDYDRVIGLGAIGVYADDPFWLSGLGESGRADWTRQTWKAGQIIAVNSRGAFKGSGKWSPADSAGQNASSLLGPLCQSSPASSYTLQGSFFIDTKGASSSPVIALHVCGADDRPFVNNVASRGYTAGYTFEVNAFGSMTLYRCDAPSTKTMIKNLGGAFTTADGTECQVKLDVSPTALTMTAVNGANTTPQTVADSTYRGGFVHAFQAGLATAFYGSLKGWTRV